MCSCMNDLNDDTGEGGDHQERLMMLAQRQAHQARYIVPRVRRNQMELKAV